MPAATAFIHGRKPSAIHHVNFKKTDNFQELALKAAKNLHMGAGEYNLLSFYASCSDGFRPASNLVCEKTGVSKTHVYGLKTMLIQHGLAYTKDGAFYIDWDRVRLFASFDSTKTDKGAFIAPINPVATQRIAEYSQLDPTWIISMPLDRVIRIFSYMSETEYKAVCRSVKREKGLLRGKKTL